MLDRFVDARSREPKHREYFLERGRMSDDPKKNEAPNVIGIAYKPHANVGRFSTQICI